VSTRKLLLADDSITIQKVVNLTFADEGIEVFTVGDGDSAIEKLAEISPDLVLADVNMPGLTGYQVCERIKNDANFRHIPVVLLIGSFEPFDEEEARRVGADDFLTKPFQSIRQLVSKVTALLDTSDKNESPNDNLTPVSSFADTLDMDKPEMSEAKEDEFGDAGMDDELIQTTPVSNFALDESAKFETRNVAESSDDPGKTQPLSVYDLKDFDFVADSADSEIQYSEERSEAPEPQIAEAETSATDSAPAQKSQKFAPYSDAGDDDFLELPFDEDDEEWEQEEDETPAPTEEIAPVIDEEKNAADQDQSPIEEIRKETGEFVEPQEFESEPAEYHNANEIVIGSLTEPAAEDLRAGGEPEKTHSETTSEFSPELIDAIADRVIAKLSDRVIREIAWEVVPQHADLIIKKMVEEKLREQ
jgi:CheY-like chemotaxis protein